ncbi:MAG: ATP-binding protein [Pseudomonadota bacterium]|nr:ATP-binding protein [Pseudomonadota bacterium]
MPDDSHQAGPDAAARLRALQRQQEVFAHGISHDLRAPLRSIETFSGMLARHAGDSLDPTGRDYLQRIRDAASRMGGLIESLLDYAWVDRNELQPTPVDLGMFAHLALAELQEARPDPALPRPVRVSVAPDLRVTGDERQLRMLMTELVRNSWNFSSGPLALEISGARVGDRLRITIRDEGRGFDMQYAPKLFEPFQRLHGADEGAGNGMGMAIALRIVERHGGRIHAESGPGGATFTIELPAADAETP